MANPIVVADFPFAIFGPAMGDSDEDSAHVPPGGSADPLGHMRFPTPPGHLQTTASAASRTLNSGQTTRIDQEGKRKRDSKAVVPGARDSLSLSPVRTAAPHGNAKRPRPRPAGDTPICVLCGETGKGVTLLVPNPEDLSRLTKTAEGLAKVSGSCTVCHGEETAVGRHRTATTVAVERLRSDPTEGHAWGIHRGKAKTCPGSDVSIV